MRQIIAVTGSCILQKSKCPGWCAYLKVNYAHGRTLTTADDQIIACGENFRRSPNESTPKIPIDVLVALGCRRYGGICAAEKQEKAAGVEFTFCICVLFTLPRSAQGQRF